MSGEPKLVLRRGHPVAGIVTVSQARALWTFERESALYSEWRAMRRLDREHRMRMAVMRQEEADRRAEYERVLLGR